MNEIPIRIEITPIKSGIKRLRPGWKSWYCEKCGDGFIYRGNRPKHTNCTGKLDFINMMSLEDEQELIECTVEEIRKETKNYES